MSKSLKKKLIIASVVVVGFIPTLYVGAGLFGLSVYAIERATSFVKYKVLDLPYVAPDGTIYK